MSVGLVREGGIRLDETTKINRISRLAGVILERLKLRWGNTGTGTQGFLLERERRAPAGWPLRFLTSGRERFPAMVRNSRTQSKLPESDKLGSTTGYSFLRSDPKFLLLITPSRAFIQFTLPRRVLISPLWAKYLVTNSILQSDFGLCVRAATFGNNTRQSSQKGRHSLG